MKQRLYTLFIAGVFALPCVSQAQQLSLAASGEIIYLEDNRSHFYNDSYSGTYESGGAPVPFDPWKNMTCGTNYMSAGLDAVYSSYYDEYEGDVYHIRYQSFDVSFRLVESMDMLLTGDAWTSWDGYAGLALYQGTNTLFSREVYPDEWVTFDESFRLAPGDYRLTAAPGENADLSFRADFAVVPEPNTGSLILVSAGLFALRRARMKRGSRKLKSVSANPDEPMRDSF